MAKGDGNEFEGAAGRQRPYLAPRLSSASLNGSQSTLSGCEVITVMQTAEPWHRYDIASWAGSKAKGPNFLGFGFRNHQHPQPLA